MAVAAVTWAAGLPAVDTWVEGLTLAEEEVVPLQAAVLILAAVARLWAAEECRVLSEAVATTAGEAEAEEEEEVSSMRSSAAAAAVATKAVHLWEGLWAEGWVLG